MTRALQAIVRHGWKVILLLPNNADTGSAKNYPGFSRQVWNGIIPTAAAGRPAIAATETASPDAKYLVMLE
jgi:hypothetical protein